MGHRIRRIVSAGTFVRLAVSIALAFVIWGFIVWETNPEVTRTFSVVEVEAINIPSDMLIVGEIPDVSLEIKGPQDTVRGMVAGDFHQYVDLADVDEPGTAQYNVQVEGPEGLRKVTVTPSMIEIELDLIVTETFPIVIHEDDPRPANVTSVELSTDLVSIQGPDDVVSQVVAVEVPVQLENRTESFTDQVPLIPVDEAGNPVAGVTVSPAEVEVSVVFETTSKVVPVRVICACIVDESLQEIELTTAAAIPSTIRLSGPAPELATVNAISTQPIDISILNESGWILDVGLDLAAVPETVTVSEQSVDVWVPVEPQRQILESIPIEVIGLAGSASVTLSDEEVSIVIVGASDLDASELEKRVKAIVDLSGLTPGSYTVDVEVVIPPGVSFDEVNPGTVRVQIAAFPVTTGRGD